MCAEKPQALQSEKILAAREGRGRREKRGDGRNTQARVRTAAVEVLLQEKGWKGLARVSRALSVSDRMA